MGANRSAWVLRGMRQGKEMGLGGWGKKLGLGSYLELFGAHGFLINNFQ